MTLTKFFAELKDDLMQMGVGINSINESTNSVHLTFKSSKAGSINISKFASTIKRVAAKYGFNDLQVFTSIENGGD